jgi:hypothetical protein
MVNRKAADDGITKSNQLKCIFDVQFHIIYIKNILSKVKGCHFIKNYINFYDSGAIIIVCICKLFLLN